MNKMEKESFLVLHPSLWRRKDMAWAPCNICLLPKVLSFTIYASLIKKKKSMHLGFHKV